MNCTLSKNLKRLRNAKNYTQEQAAGLLGVSAQTVSRWECGNTLPDVMLLPEIARLYCVTIDDLYKETSVAYENYAQRLGSIFEATLEPEDFLRADQEYKRMLKTGEYSNEDLRLYGILHQHMMHYCIGKSTELFDRVLKQGPQADPDTYWFTRRQKGYFLWEIGRNNENIEEFLPLVIAGSEDINEWICLIQAYQFAENHDAAWEWIQKAQEKFPENAMLWCYAGHTRAALGAMEDAIACWDRTLELDPEITDAMYAKAEYCEQMGNWQKAYEFWTELVDTLERRGFDMELSYPRERAKKCRELICGDAPTGNACTVRC